MPSRERQLLIASISLVKRIQKRNDDLLDDLTTARAATARLEERLSYLESAARDPQFEKLYNALRSKDDQLRTRDERIRTLENELERLAASSLTTAPIPVRRVSGSTATSRARSSSRGPPDGPLLIGGTRHPFSKPSHELTKSSSMGLRRSLNGPPKLVLSPRNKVN